MKKIHVLLGQIDDVIAREKSSENNEEVGFTPAMLTEMAGELRHALEQVSEPSAKEEKTELKKKRKQLKELDHAISKCSVPNFSAFISVIFPVSCDTPVITALLAATSTLLCHPEA